MNLSRINAVVEATRAAGVWNVPTQSLLENMLSGRSVDEMMAREEMAYMRPATVAMWRDRVLGTAEENKSFLELFKKALL